MAYIATITSKTYDWSSLSRRLDAGSSVIAAQEAGLNQLEALYFFRQAAVVRRFLRAHPQLVELLLEAYASVQHHFGSDAQVTLEIVYDPESEASDELFAYILTPLPVDEALARLDSFDEEWFIDQLDRVGGRLNFNLEFA